MMGTDVMVIGNHEFDDGALNVTRQFQKWKDFPLLSANYVFPPQGTAHDTGLDSILTPFTVFNLEGLKVGVIGMANFSSLGSAFTQPNSLGIEVLNTIETAQAYVDLLRPLVDVIVVLSHLGLDVDERMVQGTTGIDVVEGGHNHIVINPPQTIQDCSADPSNPGYVWAVNPNIPYDPSHPVYSPADTLQQHPNEFQRFCTPRNVLISHSGAFAKYVGRFDLMLSNDPKLASPTGDPNDYDPTNGFEVISSTYVPYPIDDTVPDDPNIDNLLLPYQRYLDQTVDLDLLAGYSPQGASRTAPQGGDSPMGNLISDAMWLRLGVQTDFAMTNTTGIRTDMIPGPVTIEEMFNIFPFNNTITKMQLSGTEVQQMFDFIAGRSQGRGCVSQAQIAGARVILNCGGCSRANANNACIDDDQCIGGVPGSCVDGAGNSCLANETELHLRRHGVRRADVHRPPDELPERQHCVRVQRRHRLPGPARRPVRHGRGDARRRARARPRAAAERVRLRDEQLPRGRRLGLQGPPGQHDAAQHVHRAARRADRLHPQRPALRLQHDLRHDPGSHGLLDRLGLPERARPGPTSSAPAPGRCRPPGRSRPRPASCRRAGRATPASGGACSRPAVTTWRPSTRRPARTRRRATSTSATRISTPALSRARSARSSHASTRTSAPSPTTAWR